MKKHQLAVLLRSARIPFLVLTPVSVFLGFCTSFAFSEQIPFFELLLVLQAAVSARVSVNAFKAYFDFRTRLDAKTVKTPFSGGCGALVDHPEASYVSLVPMMLGPVVFFGALKHLAAVIQLIPRFGMNVLLTVFTPIVLRLSISPSVTLCLARHLTAQEALETSTFLNGCQVRLLTKVLF
ncbi:MAG: hypothetical protein JSW48_01355 [Betaproteobacteria bacterium]|nr:MAG: hypothetical protein JSW48_01355 [Betaproteobacteria bacterium]